MEMIYRNGELGYLTTTYCDCPQCPSEQEHTEFIALTFGPATKVEAEWNNTMSSLYARIIKEQLEKPLILTKLIERDRSE